MYNLASFYVVYKKLCSRFRLEKLQCGRRFVPCLMEKNCDWPDVCLVYGEGIYGIAFKSIFLCSCFAIFYFAQEIQPGKLK